ncbi:DUF397 domain-containing protein [Streptomyces brasiliscabiei]|uniref:DUF397 domain-containing protein n=1 Tax=Streptomyces brasiliscabiei TaxID=2736302 RepID=UPI003F6866A1
MAQDLNWQKSTFSGGAEGNACVELAAAPDRIHLRESDSPGVIVTTTPTPVSHLLRSITTGRLTPPPARPPRWQKSTFSGGGEGNTCVELAAAPAHIHLRESDTPATHLRTTLATLAGLLRHIKVS